MFLLCYGILLGGFGPAPLSQFNSPQRVVEIKCRRGERCKLLGVPIGQEDLESSSDPCGGNVSSEGMWHIVCYLHHMLCGGVHKWSSGEGGETWARYQGSSLGTKLWCQWRREKWMMVSQWADTMDANLQFVLGVSSFFGLSDTIQLASRGNLTPKHAPFTTSSCWQCHAGILWVWGKTLYFEGNFTIEFWPQIRVYHMTLPTQWHHFWVTSLHHVDAVHFPHSQKVPPPALSAQGKDLATLAFPGVKRRPNKQACAALSEWCAEAVMLQTGF